MALLKIARMGHPVLVRPAEPVADPTDPAVRKLAQDMIETMIDADGVGLAAPQVHMPLRMIVFRVPAPAPADDEEADETEQERPPIVIVNPVVEYLDDVLETDFEGCLSIPGLRGVVTRPANIRYRGVGLDGAVIESEAHGGLHARVVQHEVDHLDGILYPMRMADLSLLGFSEEVGRNIDTLIDAADSRAEDGE